MKQNGILRNIVSGLTSVDWKLLMGARSIRFSVSGAGESLVSENVTPDRNLCGKTIEAENSVDLGGLGSQAENSTFIHNSRITVSSFVENKFLTEYVARKRTSGRAYYGAMLKHILKPEEVDRMFGKPPERRRKMLREITGWPYLSDVSLCDIRPEHVSRLISAVLAYGYSNQTAMHIRSVLFAIFSHAQQERFLIGANPVSLVKPPRLRHKAKTSLTMAQAKKAIEAMRHPEREMTLISVFTDMNPAEVAGLQWGRVNLSTMPVTVDGATIPPRTIAIKDHWYCGKLEPVRENCVRVVPIPSPLLHLLLRLKAQAKFNRPEDFVLVSRAGTPINQNNIVIRRLRPLAERLGVASLSWQVFRRNRKKLASELCKQSLGVEEALVPHRGSTMLRKRVWRTEGGLPLNRPRWQNQQK